MCENFFEQSWIVSFHHPRDYEGCLSVICSRERFDMFPRIKGTHWPDLWLPPVKPESRDGFWRWEQRTGSWVETGLLKQAIDEYFPWTSREAWCHFKAYLRYQCGGELVPHWASPCKVDHWRVCSWEGAANQRHAHHTLQEVPSNIPSESPWKTKAQNWHRQPLTVLDK